MHCIMQFPSDSRPLVAQSSVQQSSLVVRARLSPACDNNYTVWYAVTIGRVAELLRPIFMQHF